MQVSDIFRGLGEDAFRQLLRSISIGKLKTFQLYERFKTRSHLAKLNVETLQKAAPRLWTRLNDRNDDYATDLAQAMSEHRVAEDTGSPRPLRQYRVGVR